MFMNRALTYPYPYPPNQMPVPMTDPTQLGVAPGQGVSGLDGQGTIILLNNGEQLNMPPKFNTSGQRPRPHFLQVRSMHLP